MPQAQTCRSEEVLNRLPKCPRSPTNPEKILNSGNELKDLLKSKGLAFFKQQNELVFEREKQRLKLTSTFQMAAKPSFRRQDLGIGEAPTSDGRNLERVLDRPPKCPSSPKNPKRILNRGNELKDLLKQNGLASFKQQNELVFERQKQRLKLRSSFQTAEKPSSRRQGSGVGEAVTSEESNFEWRIANPGFPCALPPGSLGASLAHNYGK
jgi:hypothetical protein